MLNHALTGITKLLGNESVTAEEHRWSAIAIAIGTCLGTSILTRKRVNDGKESVLGFF